MSAEQRASRVLVVSFVVTVLSVIALVCVLAAHMICGSGGPCVRPLVAARQPLTRPNKRTHSPDRATGSDPVACDEAQGTSFFRIPEILLPLDSNLY